MTFKTLYELGMILLTREDGPSIVARIDAIEIIEPATNLDGPPGARARVQIAGSERFVMQDMAKILEKIEGSTS